MVDVNVADVGPIRKISIPIVPGEITLLTGYNGSGKSTAMAAVRTGVTGKNAGVTPRDGRPAGTVSVPGCTIRVGARVSKRGKPEGSYAIIEDGGGLGRLIDPGIKDPIAADRRRLEAILTATGTEYDEQAVEDFLGDDVHQEYLLSRPAKTKSIVEAAAELKKFLQEKAREYEDAVSECNGAIGQVKQSLRDGGHPVR